MFVSKKKYKSLLNELLEFRLEKDKIKKELVESNTIIKSLKEKEISIETLSKKEKQIKDSILENKIVFNDLLDHIENGTKKLNELNTEVSNTEKKLKDYKHIINETITKYKQSKIMQLGQLIKTRSYQLEQKRNSNDMLEQLNTIYANRRKNEIKLSNRLEKEIENKKTRLSKIESSIRKANNELSQKDLLLKEISDLKKKIILMREEFELQEVGFYKNVFPFLTTEQYKEELEFNNEKQKELINSKNVVFEGTKWTVNGSKREGQKLTNANIKFMIRSFNIDCDNAVSSLKYSNLLTVEKRIRKSFETINKLNKDNSLTIVDEFLRLKLEEMELVYELFEFQQEEKEKLSALKEEERERKRVEKEIQEKFNELKSRERELEKQLNVLNNEYVKSKGQDNSLLPQIKEVEDNIALVHKKREEIRSRLEIGKSGFVYIISNIGSLGEDIFKIGMTRRLEPLERIRELSAAAVPFGYDIHAMILTDNAPKLETHLHNIFKEQRVNMVNNRKEFFNVNIDRIKEEVFSVIGKDVVFEDHPRATQYYETLAIKNAIAIVNKEVNSLYH